MYVVTFYSFKGGVGRTMALVNAAFELLRLGKRVLLVDFDIEAPGIETFNALSPKPSQKGLVDYVHQYTSTGVAPSLCDFLYRCPPSGQGEGDLFVMPSGLHADGNYDSRLASIDWQDLYGRKQGYLLFENLRQQWQDEIDPEYVLIDSRTGHTDVGGICTRQLPNAVVLMFFPNDQNLLGLDKVVRDIRNEAHRRNKRPSTLHFVASNLPMLDDENGILARRLDQFRERLGYSSVASSIHHYDSLDFLDQKIFTKDRPNSRIAQEYRQLVESIAHDNPEDREGALAFLGRLPVSIHFGSVPADYEKKLDAIEAAHKQDSEVLSQLARVRELQGQLEDASALLDQVVALSPGNAGPRVQRAQLRLKLGRLEDSAADAGHVLNLDEASLAEVRQCIGVLRRASPADLTRVSVSPAVLALPLDDINDGIVEDLSWTRQAMTVAEGLLGGVLARRPMSDPEDTRATTNNLALMLIGQGLFSKAYSLLQDLHVPEASRLFRPVVFNRAMAYWGVAGEPDLQGFRHLLGSVEPDYATASPNFLQCLSIAALECGDKERAKEFWHEAKSAMDRRTTAVFSGWRYRRVAIGEFYEDLQESLSRINGSSILPRVFRQSGPQNIDDHA